MDVHEVCKPDVVVAYKSMAVSEAARLMRQRHVGSLIVVEEREGGKFPIGMLTDRDITVSVVARDLDARSLAVGEAMSTNIVAVREDDSMLDALALMRRRGVRRAPVVNRAGTLAGIVSLDALLRIAVAQLDDRVAAITAEFAVEARSRA
jgi:CBS domain-containing protein